MTIPIASPPIGRDEERLVVEVLRSGRLAQGPMVARLERLFAEMADTRHAVAVSSGTTALVAALQSLDLQSGDEVVTSPFTFVATLNAILAAGGTAVFADIGDDFTLDPVRVAEATTARTRVLMPVHLYGLAADMTQLQDIAGRAGAVIVEDAAQAHGATVDGRRVGSFGVGCFSLYATKNVTTGEGGIVTTDDDVIADRVRLLRNQGMRERYVYETLGFNYRLTDLQAAVGIPQMERLADLITQRQHNAAVLDEGLCAIRGLTLPRTPEGRSHVFHQYTVRVDPSITGIDRNQLAVRLRDKGVDTGVYYPRPVYDYGCYREHPAVRVVSATNTRRAAAEVLSLPVHTGLTGADLERIVLAVREVLHA